MEYKRFGIFPSEIKATGTADGGLEIDGLITTQRLDRTNEIMEALGVDNLADFAAVPLPLYHEHDRGSHIGHALELTPQKRQIKARFRLAPTALVRDTVGPLLQAGSLQAFSIGFVGRKYEEDKNQVLHWTQWSLMEVSLVSMPANTDAVASLAKSLGYDAGAFHTLSVNSVNHPIHEDQGYQWDSAAAEKRIRAWAGADDGPNAKYRGCFLWYDEGEADKFASYKLGVCDIFDGKPEVVWHAVAAVVGALRGGRGGVAIPANDKDRIWSLCAGYYKKFDKPMPAKGMDVEDWREGLQADEQAIVEEICFGENLRRLRGNAQSVRDCAVSWQQAGKALHTDDWVTLEEAQQFLSDVQGLRAEGSKPEAEAVASKAAWDTEVAAGFAQWLSAGAAA